MDILLVKRIRKRFYDKIRFWNSVTPDLLSSFSGKINHSVIFRFFFLFIFREGAVRSLNFIPYLKDYFISFPSHINSPFQYNLLSFNKCLMKIVRFDKFFEPYLNNCYGGIGYRTASFPYPEFFTFYYSVAPKL